MECSAILKVLGQNDTFVFWAGFFSVPAGFFLDPFRWLTITQGKSKGAGREKGRKKPTYMESVFRCGGLRGQAFFAGQGFFSTCLGYCIGVLAFQVCFWLLSRVNCLEKNRYCRFFDSWGLVSEGFFLTLFLGRMFQKKPRRRGGRRSVFWSGFFSELSGIAPCQSVWIFPVFSFRGLPVSVA